MSDDLTFALTAAAIILGALGVSLLFAIVVGKFIKRGMGE